MEEYKEKLRARLRAVRQLKSEYYIGTADAYEIAVKAEDALMNP